MDDIQGELEDLVLRLTEGRTVMGPITVEDIILESASRLRLVPERSVLDAAVGKLVGDGLVRETSEGNLVDARSSAGSLDHSPISDETYAAALEAHHAGHRRDQQTDSLSTAVLHATIRLAGPHAPLTEWRRAEFVAVALVDALRSMQRHARVPWITSTGATLEFQVLASANDEPGKIHRMVAPVFAAAAPAGSELRPIRIPLP